MKKISALIIACIFGTSCLVGCGSADSKLNEQQNQIIEEIKGQDGEVKDLSANNNINDAVNKVAPNSKTLSVVKKDKATETIIVKMNIDKSNNKEELKKFIDNSINVSSDLEHDLNAMGSKTLAIFMDVNNTYTGNNIIFKMKDKKLEVESTKIADDYTQAFEEVRKEEQDSQNTSNNKAKNNSQPDEIVKSTSLKSTEYYKELSKAAGTNIEVLEVNEDLTEKNQKLLSVEIKVKDGTDEEMVKNYYDAISKISTFVSTNSGENNYSGLTINDKKIGMTYYSTGNDKNLVFNSVVFLDSKYQPIFDKLRVENDK